MDYSVLFRNLNYSFNCEYILQYYFLRSPVSRIKCQNVQNVFFSSNECNSVLEILLGASIFTLFAVVYSMSINNIIIESVLLKTFSAEQ